MRLAGRGAVLVVVGALGLAAWAHAQQTGHARVVLARPPVEVVLRGQTVARPLLAGMRLGEGDRVRTGRGGAAEVELGDGSLVRLGELSDLEIDRLDVDATGAPTTSRFALAAGQARAWVARQVIAKVALGQGRFAVETPTAVAAVRQTDFAVLHDAQAVSRVYTFAGAVEISRPGGGWVVCTRNRWTLVVPGRDPEPCRVIPLRDKRAILNLLAFQSATVDPGDLDRAAMDSLGAKLSGERMTGGRLFGIDLPTRTGRSDAPSGEAPAGVTITVE